MDVSKELSTIATTRVTEWQLFWVDRIAQYWSLGYVNPANYWRL